MIAKLRDGDVRQQTRARLPARDRQRRHRRLHHGLAGAARVGGAHVTDHLEAAGDVLEDLGHILTHLAQPIAAAGATGGRRRLVRLRRAGQMLGQLATALLLASFSRFRIG